MTRPSTRRTVLQAIGTVTLGSVAGCSSRSTQPSSSTTSAKTTAAAATTKRETEEQTEQETTEQADLKDEPLQASGDWPTYHYDNSNSSYPSKARGVSTAGTPYWRIENGYAPVFSDGTIYLRVAERGVVAVDAQTGAEKWNSDVDAGSPSLAVAEDTVFVTGLRGVFSLDTATGSVTWSRELARGNASAPTVDGETLYFCHGEYDDKPVLLIALEAATGERRWTAELDGRSPDSIAVTQDAVFVTTTGVHAFDTETGAKRWSVSLGGSVDGIPVVRDDRVYVTDHDGVVYAIDIERERVDWRTETGTSTSEGGLAVTDQTIYYSGEDAVYAFDIHTGEQRWEFPTASAPQPPTVANDTVYFGTGFNERYLRAIDATTGDERWKYRFPRVNEGDYVTGGVVGAPVVVHDALYVRSADGFVYAFGEE